MTRVKELIANLENPNDLMAQFDGRYKAWMDELMTYPEGEKYLREKAENKIRKSADDYISKIAVHCYCEPDKDEYYKDKLIASLTEMCEGYPEILNEKISELENWEALKKECYEKHIELISKF